MMVPQIMADAEARRVRADYDTGSITAKEAELLLTLAEDISARVVIEVGTFIGVSTKAMAAASTVEAVYTCDASNDCLESDRVICTYPKQTSTEMLHDLINRHVRADLCFFDGVLAVEDGDLLMQVTHHNTVYAFHDYNYGSKIRKGGRLEHNVPRKGIGNYRILCRIIPGNYVMIPPLPDTTLAILKPDNLA
jgi:hypothetical protein